MAQKRPKRPKQPKRTSSIRVWQAYSDRLTAWESKCKQIIADKKKKADLIEKLSRKRFAF